MLWHLLHVRDGDLVIVDLQPGMVSLAVPPSRRWASTWLYDRPAIHDGILGGVLAWYSIVRTPLRLLLDVFAQFFRVLAVGGQLLLGFHIADERRRMTAPTATRAPPTPTGCSPITSRRS